MQFSNHIKSIRDQLRLHIMQGKVELLTGLHDCALRAKSLLQTSKFDFWIEQFELIELNEIPTTPYAVESVRHFLFRTDLLIDNTRASLSSEISWACENLLTFTIDDCCCMQTEFHWYYCISENFPFKESEMGVVEVPSGKDIIGRKRIAKISELPPELQKYAI